MRKWISILLIAALMISGGVFWESWLPSVAAFALRQEGSLSFKRIGLFLLEKTDPVMKNVGLYLASEPKEAPDELFLYFQEEETPLPEVPSIQAANLSALSFRLHKKGRARRGTSDT